MGRRCGSGRRVGVRKGRDKSWCGDRSWGQGGVWGGRGEYYKRRRKTRVSQYEEGKMSPGWSEKVTTKDKKWVGEIP